MIGPQNLSNNCNLAAFKFELNKILPVVTTPAPLICIPAPVIFSNNSANGNTFFWQFGDGGTSTAVNPTHYYTTPGNYTVELIVSDSNNCFSSDSVFFNLEIGDFQGGVVTPPTPVCPGIPYQLEAYGGANYSWTPTNVLNNPTIPNPIATITTPTTFTVIISDSCGSDTLQVTLQVYTINESISSDTSLCIGNSTILHATGGGTYQWSPPTFLDNPTSGSPVCTPTQTTTYDLEIITSDGCHAYDTVTVSVFYNPPTPNIPDTVKMCLNGPTLIQVSGAETYTWTPDLYITPSTGSMVTVNPPNDMMYYCNFQNACGNALDSVFVDVVFPLILAGNDTIVCPQSPAFLWASGGVSYTWTPINSILNPNLQDVTVYPPALTKYIVTGMDQYGCTDTASVTVDLFPSPHVLTSPDVLAYLGDQVQLSASSTTSGNYVWSPSDYLSCVTCINPVANPDKNFTYTVTFTDANGCKASDDVHITYNGIIYVPNTFTPGGDVNSVFQAIGGNIDRFEMYIFDRWGELICTMKSLDEFWDGTYQGNKCQDGTYTWKIIYSDFNNNRGELVGHVNLLR